MSGWGEVIGGPKVWARDLGLAVAAGLALAFIGPFGSYGLPLESRLLICVGFGLAGSVVFWPALRLALRLGARAGLPELFAVVVGLVVAAAPVTLVVRLVQPLLNPAGPPPNLAPLYFAVLALVMPIGLAALLIGRWAAPAAEVASPPPPTDAREPPRLLSRLPKRLGTEVIALEAEDHYVRVHTTLGSDLILMRLADAIAEMDGVEGLRVHRSWWVVRAAVQGGRAEGRRATLLLGNGLAAPVTREVVPEIRRAGWL